MGTPQISWICLLFFGSFISFISAQANTGPKIAITNPVPLYSDGAIKAGIPLVIGCNADAVGLDTQYITIVKLQIQRQLHSSQSRDTIAIYHPYSQLTPARPDPYNPDSRDWEFTYTEAPALSVGVNSRSLTLEWTLNDARCSDAGVYQCIVDYVDGDVEASSEGQQNLTSRAAITNLYVSILPQRANNEFTENENVTMSCMAEGPPNMQMEWRYGQAEGLLQVYPFSSDISKPNPTEKPNDECGAMRYRSTLSLQLSLPDSGYMYACYVRFGQDPWHSDNLTISISPEAVNPFNNNGNPAAASSGGDDTGMIIGIVFGVLALIIIVLLVLYFCWWRKRNGSDRDKDAEEDTKPDMHAPPPVFYSKPNKPPKDDRDDGTWGKESDATDTWGRKPRYDTYDNDGGNDYNSGRKPSSSSTGGRRGRYGSSSSAVRDRDGYPSRSAYDEDDNGYGPDNKDDSYDSRSRPRYEKRKSKDSASPHAPVNTTDVSTRSEDEASDAPLSGTYGQKPRPKRRTSRPSSGSEDRDDRKGTYRRGDRDRETEREGDRDRERRGDPALHYAQLDLAPSADRERGRRGGRRDDRRGEPPVEYAEIRV